MKTKWTYNIKIQKWYTQRNLLALFTLSLSSEVKIKYHTFQFLYNTKHETCCNFYCKNCQYCDKYLLCITIEIATE